MPKPTPTVDPWQPMRQRDHDPFYQRGGPSCEALSPPDQTFVCTRALNHPGVHVASYGDGSVCCDSWGLDVNQRLPRGF